MLHFVRCYTGCGLSWRAYAEESGDGNTGSIATPKAAVLMEAETGQVLYSVNAQARLPMASITKVMSLLVLADMIDAGELQLTDAVKASSYASSAEGSVIWLEAGEEMTAAELLEAVIVSSANDAAIALAEHAAGSGSGIREADEQTRQGNEAEKHEVYRLRRLRRRRPLLLR